ncbi:amidase [Chelatococcus sp. GCM10030263]|uniref:amidase n=1 Tax=Chelatococcus sp. GCM10030263 TaxID=3273387 RepID=UPI00361997D4
MSGTDAPLWSLTAGDLAAGYRAGLFTPIEAIEAVLMRLEAVNPAINAVVALDRDRAREDARRSAARWQAGAALSALDGVPITVKDNLYLEGFPATWGSRLYADFMPDHDEPAVARLRAAGAVLFGKTNVPEFTVQGYTSNLLFGTTRNPHALQRTPGGSTGGGAAAVAAGIGPIAIGTDGGGSLRRPAGHCGLYAFKPSAGQVIRYDGFPQILGDFEVIGPVARSPGDLLATHEILAGYNPADPRSLASLAVLPPFAAVPRVGYLPRVGDNPVDPSIAAAVDRFVAQLADAGLPVTSVEVPYEAGLLAAAWSTVAQAGLAWHLSKVPDWQSKVNPTARAMAEEGARRTAADIFDALAAAAEARRQAGIFFSHFDLLVCPATAALAWPAEEVFPSSINGQAVGPRGHAVFTGWMNIAGLPAATVPLAMTPDNGGIGVQIVAGHGRDRDLLAFIATSPALREFAPAPLAILDGSS